MIAVTTFRTGVPGQCEDLTTMTTLYDILKKAGCAVEGSTSRFVLLNPEQEVTHIFEAKDAFVRV